MNILSRVVVICAGLLIAACGERAADVSKPQRYEKLGVTFLYPGNWMIDEDRLLEGVHHVSMATAGNALVVVQFFPLGTARSLEDYARAFSKETAAAVPEGKMTGSKFTPQAEVDGYQCLKENC
ncbi:MAG: lipoprotein, partial [Prosthecobacter sp.]|nr:lipoprotein [Prosthecobacter sp.]